ncbi:MAG: hypothetical protein Q8P49_04105 [Candidatus Liptonbacteria bacterium]|nr:hypothetical protein [Candidatus Liptonbacteria bacterium]
MEQPGRDLTTTELQTMFARIYANVLQRYTDEGMLLRLCEETGKLMEIMRKDRYNNYELPLQIGKLFSWWFLTGTKLDIDLQEALWAKYPGICTWCLRSDSCLCGVEHPGISNREEIVLARRRERTEEPKTLKEHQELQRRLYGKQGEQVHPIRLAAHVSEEVGELSREFRYCNFEGVCDEIPDIASWLFAVANRCGFGVAEIISRMYPDKCTTCGNAVCNCPSSDRLRERRCPKWPAA